MTSDLRGRILVLILFTELVLLAGSTGEVGAGENSVPRIHR